MSVTDNAGVLKNVDYLEYTEADTTRSFLVKKAEKLATAAYLVTGFLSDSEPIKWQIRECGLRILSDVSFDANFLVSDISQRVKRTVSDIGKIISFFDIAAATGFVSNMNASLIKEEYRALLDVIKNQKIGTPESGHVFSKEFFSAPPPAVPSVLSKETFAPDGDSNQKPLKKYDSFAGYDGKEQSFKNFSHRQEDNPDGVSGAQAREAPTGMKTEKTFRRDTILQRVKDRGDGAEVSIKDIIGYFSDCGEKTIQRELSALVREGVLKKTGDRRWSRYSLA